MVKDGVIKLVDFGLSFHLNTQSQLINSSVGKPLYAAPEMFQDVDYKVQKADIYSFGCVIFFLCTGKDVFNKIPLSNYSCMRTLDMIEIPSMYSKDLRDIML